MTTSQRLLKATVDRHWSELMQAITQAQRDKALPENFPRDYIANTTWTDGWRDLLAREVADERRHRKFAPDGYRYTYGVTDAARLMILKFVAEGARLEAMPTALDCMTPVSYTHLRAHETPEHLV